MTTHDANERKPIVEFGRRRGGERPRLRAPGRSVLIFVISMAACGFLTWWLWARFRIRFYFIFIPFIGIGGPLLGRLRRKTGAGPDGETGGEGRLLEDRRDEGGDREERTP